MKKYKLLNQAVYTSEKHVHTEEILNAINSRVKVQIEQIQGNKNEIGCKLYF